MKCLCLIFILFIGFSCSDKENNEIEEQMNPKFAAINICGDTDDADILLLCDNGSYILCDAENEKGYSVLYMNESIDNDFESGLTVFLNEKGTPVMAASKDGHFIFKNVTDDSFDFAFINNKDKITCYYDVKLDPLFEPSASTRSFFDPWINSFKSPTGGEWDEHAKKAIIPFILKIASFAITACDAVWGTGQFGLLTTFFSETYKSNKYKYEWLDTFFDGISMLSVSLSGLDMKRFLNNNGEVAFTKAEFGISYLAYQLNNYADKQLEKLGQYEEWIGPNFNSEEWQIRLSTNLLECLPDDSLYLVDVNVDSRVAWEIDESKVDHNWCDVMKLDMQIAVHVKSNEQEYDRTCELIIKPKYSTEIAPVILEIKQSGIVFYLHPDTLTFSHAGGTKGFTIISNDNIRSWSVSSYPSWCKIERGGDTSYWVVVEKNEKENRDDIITVTGITKGGMHVDRTLVVEQKYQLCPDNKHPHMIDLGLPSGTKWACCNIGATKPEEIGSLFAWGETDTKESFSWENYRYWTDINGDGRVDDNEIHNFGDDISGTSYDAAKANWGSSWHMPTTDDFWEMINNTTRRVVMKDKQGYIFTGKNGNEIFMPCDKTINNYWTSINKTTFDIYYPSLGLKAALSIGFNPEWIYSSHGYKCNGFLVRAISDK